MIQRLSIDAFAASPEMAALLREATSGTAFRRCRLSVQESGLAGAAAHYAERPTPQLVIVEEGDRDDLTAQLDRLADVCGANTKVMVIGGLNDIQLYRALIGRGVSEYLPRPVTARQVSDAIAALFSDSRSTPRGRSLAFWGARGGAGSSSLAQNLAWQIGRHLGEAVLYIDLDLWFGTSLLAFNIEAKQTVADALLHPERLDDVLMERCLIDYDDHLRILASAGDCRTAPAVTLDGVEALVDMARRLAPVVVLDLPRVWADWTRFCLDTADEVLITAHPDFASARDCKTLLDSLAASRNGAAQPKLLLNKIDPGKKTQLPAKDFQEALGLAPALVLPFESALFGEAVNLGQTLGETGRGHKVTLALQSLAQSLAGRAEAGKPKNGSGLLKWLRR